jgi:hypothetical protein
VASSARRWAQLVPFKGGTLAPSPDGFLNGLPIDGNWQ